MSGRKQHFIPQSLLRAFGKKGKGAKVQVTVYDRQRGVFSTATDGIAAERHFYSELQVEGDDPTLDDCITGYETPLSVALARTREAPLGSAVEPALAGELVAHLTIRNAHVRESFDNATGQMLGEMHEIFTDRDRSRRAMGLDLDKPSSVVLDEIDKLWKQLEPTLKQAGMSKSVFYDFAFSKMKEIFETGFVEQKQVFGDMLGEIQNKRTSMVRDAHNKALGSALAPPIRVEVLRTFQWRVLAGPEGGLVLPDCVAVVSLSGASHQPLVFGDNDEIDGVYMPLSTDRVLVGERGCGVALPEQVNKISAQCSWDFFVAAERHAQLESYRSIIGERTRQLLDEVRREAMNEIP